MSKNFQLNKSVLNFIHARDYFIRSEIEEFRGLLDGVHWNPAKFGLEMPQFQLIFKDIELVFGEMLGEYVKVDESASGSFRKSYPGIHFEDFKSTNEWIFVVALEPNEFTTYTHIEGYKTALEAPDSISFEDESNWEIESKVKLSINDCIFFRPWLFHSFSAGIIHYYKLLVE